MPKRNKGHPKVVFLIRRFSDAKLKRRKNVFAGFWKRSAFRLPRCLRRKLSRNRWTRSEFSYLKPLPFRRLFQPQPGARQLRLRRRHSRNGFPSLAPSPPQSRRGNALSSSRQWKFRRRWRSRRSKFPLPGRASRRQKPQIRKTFGTYPPEPANLRAVRHAERARRRNPRSWPGWRMHRGCGTRLSCAKSSARRAACNRCRNCAFRTRRSDRACHPEARR